jgi:hypothetical protein
MNILRIEFHELYQRHLCRHGQLGVNLWHVIAVCGIYFSIYSLAVILIRALLPDSTQIERTLLLVLLSLPWLVILARNIPAAVMVLTLACTGLLIAAAVLTPSAPVWLHLLLIPAWHRVQLMSHKPSAPHRDMSAFDEKYIKGRTLCLLLAVYELPILLQYLAFGRRDWIR